MSKKVFIDADSILYKASHITNNQDHDLAEAQAILEDDGEDIGLDTVEEVDNLEAMMSVFNSMVTEIMVECHLDAKAKGYTIEGEPVIVLTVKTSAQVCVGMDNNFRYEVMDNVPDLAVKGYKQNRAGMEVPDGLGMLYDHVFALPNCFCEEGVEADDIVVYYGREGHIVAALDKDVLGSLEYAYNYGKKEWIENTPEEIKRFPYYQTITGDSSDGLRGVFRVGPKKADVALENLVDHYEMWAAVVKQYFGKDQSLEEAVATMRCVRMDQWTPEAGLVLWTPPKRGEV